MRVFVDVDVQNDFCLPSGALSVAGSPNDLYRALVNHARAKKIPILGSVDSHAYEAWEFASSTTRGPNGEKPNFPDHCVKGTAGWLKIEGTLPERFRFVPNQAGADIARLATEIGSGATQGLYFEKEVYSLFVNPNAEALLAAMRASAPTPLECVVFGVATDYCVKAAALGLRERGYDTVVLSDGVAGINDEGTRSAFAEMTSAGVRIVLSGDVLGEG